MNETHSRLIVTATLLATLLLAGCASAPERQLSRALPSYAMLPNGNNPLHPDQRSPLADQLTNGGTETFLRSLERKHGRPLNGVSISGGGQNGAFGAGFLVGWRESGRRPQLDIVGGVSTGALLATHAFLGTPADDAKLVEMYTQISKEDIYQDRGVLSILSGADSLKDTTPLRALIAKYITRETLSRVAAAYHDNRQIWIGTTNVDYDQTWVWNLSEVARAGDLELYRKVLLASASFPIVFPPVEIEGHLFVDGAARSNLVVPGTAGKTRPPPPLYGSGNLYLIDNGKIEQAPEALRRALGDVAATTVSVMMNHSMQTALMRSYFGTQLLGYNFKMVGIAPSVEIGKDPLAFDPKQMQAAFDEGRARAKQPEPWETIPPSVNDLPPWLIEAFKKKL